MPATDWEPLARTIAIVKDSEGHWWSTYFGSDGQVPWQGRPGILPIESDDAGRVQAKIP